jgi:hypothetical protein
VKRSEIWFPRNKEWCHRQSLRHEESSDADGRSASFSYSLEIFKIFQLIAHLKKKKLICYVGIYFQISAVVTKKQTVALMERDMDVWLKVK